MGKLISLGNLELPEGPMPNTIRIEFTCPKCGKGYIATVLAIGGDVLHDCECGCPIGFRIHTQLVPHIDTQESDN